MDIEQPYKPKNGPGEIILFSNVPELEKNSYIVISGQQSFRFYIDNQLRYKHGKFIPSIENIFGMYKMHTIPITTCDSGKRVKILVYSDARDIGIKQMYIDFPVNIIKSNLDILLLSSIFMFIAFCSLFFLRVDFWKYLSFSILNLTISLNWFCFAQSIQTILDPNLLGILIIISKFIFPVSFVFFINLLLFRSTIYNRILTLFGCYLIVLNTAMLVTYLSRFGSRSIVDTVLEVSYLTILISIMYFCIKEFHRKQQKMFFAGILIFTLFGFIEITRVFKPALVFPWGLFFLVLTFVCIIKTQYEDLLSKFRNQTIELTELNKLKDKFIERSAHVTVDKRKFMDFVTVHNNLDKIEFVQSSGNYSEILGDGLGNLPCLLSISLNDLTKLFDESELIRVRNNYLVNPGFLSSVKRKTRSTYDFITHSGSAIPIGKTYLKKIKKRFPNLFSSGINPS